MSSPEIKPGHERTFQIVVFRWGNEEYALPIDQIKEVVPILSITKMPQSSPWIKGVANIRGNIIAILDLAQRLGLEIDEDAKRSTGKYTLVVESDEFKMGILVKEVPNTLPISESAIDQTVFNDGEHNYIRGIVKLKDRLIVLMDIFAVMSQKDLNTNLQKLSA